MLADIKSIFLLFIHLSHTLFNKSHRISRYKANHDFISFTGPQSAPATVSVPPIVALCCFLFICAIKPGDLH